MSEKMDAYLAGEFNGLPFLVVCLVLAVSAYLLITDKDHK